MGKVNTHSIDETCLEYECEYEEVEAEEEEESNY